MIERKFRLPRRGGGLSATASEWAGGGNFHEEAGVGGFRARSEIMGALNKAITNEGAAEEDADAEIPAENCAIKSDGG